MPNRSYLCGSRESRIQPSNWDENYVSHEQTLVNDVYGVPALWFALFRPSDIVTQVFETEDGDFHVEAPINSKEKALEQLKDATEVLVKVFSGVGDVHEYIDFFEQAIAASEWPFVTIEMEEIAYTSDPEEFYRNVRRLLEKFEQHTANGVLDLLLELSAFEDLSVLPPARYHLDSPEDVTKNDAWNHCRMIGAGQLNSGIGKSVPWEPTDA